jgi:putative ABC transport system permease protein
MLTESLVVSFAGSAAGIALATWGLTTFRNVMPAQFSGLPNLDKLAIDFPVLLAAVALTIVTGLVFGAVPAFMSSSQNVSAALNEEGRGASGGRQTLRLRSGLVVAELALSVILLVGASLLILSFYRLTNVSPGFRSDEITAAEIALPSRRYPNAARAVQFYEDLYARLRAMPGVKAVAATAALPFSGEDSRLDLEFENRTFESQTPIRAHVRMVSTGYLNTMGIPLIRGRQFTDGDNGLRDVVIINEAAARAYWPGEDPTGQRISLGSPTRWMEIIGIAGDVRHVGLEKDPEPEAYIPQLQGFDSLGSGFGLGMSVVIRSSSDIGTIAPFLRAAVRELDPLQPVGSMVRLDDMIAESVAPRRLNFILVSAFAVLAVVLTAAGLYGVMSYIVTQRTREIGVRMALGATRRQVLAMVVRQVGTIATIGIGVGVAGALVLTRWISSMLFGIDPADPVVYAGVAILLALVALLAAAIPSGRASRIDPLRALRES